MNYNKLTEKKKVEIDILLEQGVMLQLMRDLRLYTKAIYYSKC